MLLSLQLSAQDDLEVANDAVITMEAFNVSIYEGKIPIIDGFTGKKYRGDHEVVFEFGSSFNDLLMKYHRKLLVDEIKHMNFRIELGKSFEKEMNALMRSFDFSGFTLDKSQWLTRERHITARLIEKPFF